MYGGYCFFNNAAIAAHAITQATGERVAILDVDYHHGNGTQQIFWRRGDVRYVSIHADPDRQYPYFLGRADETGEGDGAGENLNIPLRAGATNADYLEATDRAIEAIAAAPGSVVVVSLGFDTYGLDPIGDFALTTDVYHEVGRRVAALGRRLVILQEGGYHRPSLGENARAWLRGAEGRDFDPMPSGGFSDGRRRRRLTLGRTIAAMSSPTDLPPNVRRLVDEIENEIGETSVAIDDITGSRGRDHAGEAPTDNGKVEAAVREILLEIGEDPDRQGLLGTPERVHRMYTELTAGYHVDPDRLINGAIFDVDYSEMVIVKDIPFYSLCEHHLLPFFGTAAVAYIPRGRVIGLSKIPRIVEMYARRLQVQERLTQEIAHFLAGSPGAAGRRRRHRGDPPVRGHARRAQARDGHDDLVRARAVPDPRPDPLRVPRPPRAARPRR